MCLCKYLYICISVYIYIYVSMYLWIMPYHTITLHSIYILIRTLIEQSNTRCRSHPLGNHWSQPPSHLWRWQRCRRSRQQPERGGVYRDIPPKINILIGNMMTSHQKNEVLHSQTSHDSHVGSLKWYKPKPWDPGGMINHPQRRCMLPLRWRAPPSWNWACSPHSNSEW